VGTSWLDATRDRIWVQTFPPRYTDTELFHAFDELDALVARVARDGHRYCLISDVTRARVGNAVHRKRIAETFTTTRRLMGDRVAGQGFVMAHAVQRGALTAILWLGRPPWPIETFATREAAIVWAEQKLRTPR
jgi:hypothetical protein